MTPAFPIDPGAAAFQEQVKKAYALTERYDVQLTVAMKWVRGELEPPSWVDLDDDGKAA